MDSPEIGWTRDWDTAFALARSERKVVFIDLEKEHRIGCDRLDAVTYPDPAVWQTLAARFIALRLDHRDPHVMRMRRRR